MKTKVFILLISCLGIFQGFSQESLSKKEKKELAAQENYNKTKTLVDSKNYEFVGNWMFLQGGKRVSMITPPNNFKIEGEKVTSNLPFRGNKQFLGGESGLVFEGDLDEYTVDYNDKKKKIKIKFKHNSGTESFRFTAEVLADGTTNLVVASNKRNTISYSGLISNIKK
jgi:hypothetical protein